MGFSNHTELVANVKATLHRSDITDAQVEDWIRMTELDVERRFGVRENEVVTTGTVIQGVIVLPDDWIAIRALVLDQDGPKNIELIPARQAATIVGRSLEDGQARYGYIHGDVLALGPDSIDGIDYTLSYVASRINLKTQTTNFILERAPDVYLYGALTHSAPFLGEDERAQIWNSYYGSALNTFEEMLWNSKFDGISGRTRSSNDLPTGKILQRQTR